MNSVILCGRTTKDIELRMTTTGKATCSFTLAVAKDKDNADFFNCVAWNQRAEVLSNYVHKGDKILIRGRLSTRNYKNRDGQNVYVTEVIADEVEFCEKRDTAPEAHKQPVVNENIMERDFIPDDISADELPF